jgi:hypothetical protein
VHYGVPGHSGSPNWTWKRSGSWLSGGTQSREALIDARIRLGQHRSLLPELQATVANIQHESGSASS